MTSDGLFHQVRLEGGGDASGGTCSGSDGVTSPAASPSQRAPSQPAPSRPAPSQPAPPLATRLLEALKRTAGFGRACRRGLASEQRMARQLEKTITRKGRLRWCRVFGRHKRRIGTVHGSPVRVHGSTSDAAPGMPTAAAPATAVPTTARTATSPLDPCDLPCDLPINLEVASGTGEWAVAQALADVGKANWAAIELRHDRVYSTFSRMALQVGTPSALISGRGG
jgi:hypothetical protein